MFDRGLCLPASPQVGIFDWVEFGNRNWAPVKYAALSLREFHGVKKESALAEMVLFAWLARRLPAVCLPAVYPPSVWWVCVAGVAGLPCHSFSDGRSVWRSIFDPEKRDPPKADKSSGGG